MAQSLRGIPGKSSQSAMYMNEVASQTSTVLPQDSSDSKPSSFRARLKAKLQQGKQLFSLRKRGNSVIASGSPSPFPSTRVSGASTTRLASMDTSTLVSPMTSSHNSVSSPNVNLGFGQGTLPRSSRDPGTPRTQVPASGVVVTPGTIHRSSLLAYHPASGTNTDTTPVTQDPTSVPSKVPFNRASDSSLSSAASPQSKASTAPSEEETPTRARSPPPVLPPVVSDSKSLIKSTDDLSSRAPSRAASSSSVLSLPSQERSPRPSGSEGRNSGSYSPITPALRIHSSPLPPPVITKTGQTPSPRIRNATNQNTARPSSGVRQTSLSFTSERPPPPATLNQYQLNQYRHSMVSVSGDLSPRISGSESGQYTPPAIHRSADHSPILAPHSGRSGSPRANQSAVRSHRHSDMGVFPGHPMPSHATGLAYPSPAGHTVSPGYHSVYAVTHTHPDDVGATESPRRASAYSAQHQVASPTDSVISSGWAQPFPSGDSRRYSGMDSAHRERVIPNGGQRRWQSAGELSQPSSSSRNSRQKSELSGPKKMQAVEQWRQSFCMADAAALEDSNLYGLRRPPVFLESSAAPVARSQSYTGAQPFLNSHSHDSLESSGGQSGAAHRHPPQAGKLSRSSTLYDMTENSQYPTSPVMANAGPQVTKGYREGSKNSTKSVDHHSRLHGRPASPKAAARAQPRHSGSGSAPASPKSRDTPSLVNMINVHKPVDTKFATNPLMQGFEGSGFVETSTVPIRKPKGKAPPNAKQRPTSTVTNAPDDTARSRTNRPQLSSRPASTAYHTMPVGVRKSMAHSMVSPQQRHSTVVGKFTTDSHTLPSSRARSPGPYRAPVRHVSHSNAGQRPFSMALPHVFADSSSDDHLPLQRPSMRTRHSDMVIPLHNGHASQGRAVLNSGRHARDVPLEDGPPQLTLGSPTPSFRSELLPNMGSRNPSQLSLSSTHHASPYSQVPTAGNQRNSAVFLAMQRTSRHG
ncbi:hypothetical protein IWQ61_008080 [Dispira simplex]|nr:hypothetical protein IWQ61_008080 [Dispira simplex]